MANGPGRYGGSYGGYGGYGGRSYRYQQPTAFQYQSFFDPVPIEFISEQLGKRQNTYDAAYTGTIAARDLMLQEVSALEDSDEKQRIVQQTMQDIDKTVQERYGGDWGRGAKDIARMVSDARANPFWDLTKHLSQQQKVQQKARIEIGPKLLEFNDVLGKGVVNPETGGYRDPSELTFRGFERGPWEENVSRMMDGLSKDIIQSALEDGGVPDYYKYTTTKELDSTKLRMIADHPAVVKHFKDTNPDFVESKLKIDGVRERDVDTEVSDYIYGQIVARQTSEVTENYLRNYSFDIDPDTDTDKKVPPVPVLMEYESPAIDIDIPGVNLKLSDIRKNYADVQNAVGADRIQLEKEFERNADMARLLIETAYRQGSGINYDLYFEQYQELFENETLAAAVPEDQRIKDVDEFREAVDNVIIYGEQAERRIGAKPLAAFVTGTGARERNPVHEAADRLLENIKTFQDKEGSAVAQGNILTGEDTPLAVRTFIGAHDAQMNKDLHTKNILTGFNIPYTGEQVETYIKENYEGEHDRSKMQISTLDYPMDGKMGYRLDLYDENGDPVTQIPIVSDVQQTPQDNMLRSAEDARNAGYHNIANRLEANVTYGIPVQQAEIYSKKRGMIPTVKHHIVKGPRNEDIDSYNIHFERQPTSPPSFKLYLEDTQRHPDGSTTTTKRYLIDDKTKREFVANNEQDIFEFIYRLNVSSTMRKKQFQATEQQVETQ